MHPSWHVRRFIGLVVVAVFCSSSEARATRLIEDLAHDSQRTDDAVRGLISALANSTDAGGEVVLGPLARSVGSNPATPQRFGRSRPRRAMAMRVPVHRPSRLFWLTGWWLGASFQHCG